jgi:hypothetical protein
MQTFLPYPDFKLTAKCLDWRRLGKQRVEAYQILLILKGKTTAWKNHPAVKMWQGYEQALTLYKNTCIIEWISRGYNNNMIIENINNVIMPDWLGNTEFHKAHRSNLLRKNYEFYKQYKWKEPNNLPYIWPTKRTIGEI